MIKNIQRLLYIEAKLILSKLIVRRDIAETYQVGQATATRDITEYRELAPHNLVYLLSPKKAWHAAPAFKPIFFSATELCGLEYLAQRYLDSVSDIVFTCSICTLNQELVTDETCTTEMA